MALVTPSGKTKWLHTILLALAILIAYYKVLHAGFMNWDDLDYVFNIKDLNSGMNYELLRRWFTQNYLGNYQPLPVLTYAFDHFIAGPNPLVYHIDSLLWHLGATLLVYVFISRLHPNRWVAFFTALLFAVHPVQTESVSWIAARNKSMNAVFYFGAACLYISYVRTHKKSLLLWVTLCGLLAYLCKATALALPLALFAVDIWLKRPLNTRQVWLEKLPLILVGIPVALVTLSAQKDVTFLQHHEGFGWNNIVYAGYALVQYALHLVFPYKLSVLYPYPKAVSPEHILYLLPATALVALMILAYIKGRRVWAAGILFFIVNLLPVLQLVQFGETLMADRYLYIACIGLWFPLVYGIFRVFENKPGSAAMLISGGLCTVFLVMTFYRNNIWLNEINFWNSVLEKFPESAVAHYSMGGALMKKGDLDNAEYHMNKAVECDPGNYKAWRNKGSLNLRQGKTKEALLALNRSIALYPYSRSYFTRAMLYHGMGDFSHALRDISKVLEQEPDNARAWYIKADCEEQLGQPVRALEDYSNAIAYDRNESLFLIRRGLLQAKNKNQQAAFSDLDNAVALNPGSGEALYYRALVHYNFGQSPCNDLYQALQRGYRQAGEMMNKVCR